MKSDDVVRGSTYEDRRYAGDHGQQVPGRSLPNSVVRPRTIQLFAMSKRNNVETEPIFSGEHSTISEDCLSQLFDDCLLDILARVDHNDLNEFATLGKRMSFLSDLSRSKARLLEAQCLSICQYVSAGMTFLLYVGHYRQFLLSKEDSDYALYQKITGEQIFKDKPVKTYTTPGPMALRQTRRATALLDKFIFGAVSICSVFITDDMLDLLEKVQFTQNYSHKSCFTLSNTAFDEHLSSGGKQRFLSILLAAKISWLELSIDWDISLFTESFLHEYITNRPLAYIKIESTRNDRTYLTLSMNFATVLSKFGTLWMDFLVLDADWLLLPLLQRLRARRHGNWRFLTTRRIERMDISIALRTDVKLSSDANEIFDYRIDLVRTNYYVIIATRPYQLNDNNEGLFILEAKFSQ